MILWDLFNKREQVTPAPDPTDLLVGLICQRILAEPKGTDDLLVRGYYDGHFWDWTEKGIVVDFSTACHSSNSRPYEVNKVTHRNEEIKLTDHQKRTICEALCTSNQFVRDSIVAEALRVEKMRACDALAEVLGVDEGETV